MSITLHNMSGSMEVPDNYSGIITMSENCEYHLLNGELHREDGPALKRYGYEEWCLNGERHRQDGPAVTYVSGKKEFWLFGKATEVVAFEMFYLLVYRKDYDHDAS